MLIVVVLVTTIMSQRTSWPFAKLTSPVTFIVSQRGFTVNAGKSIAIPNQKT
jgi:hypothetical protein